MDLQNSFHFLTDFIKITDLQKGDLVIHENGDIDEVLSFSGFVLVLKPIVSSTQEKPYVWNIKDHIKKMIQIIKENGES